MGGEMDGRRYLLPIVQVFDDGKSNSGWNIHYMRCNTDEAAQGNVILDRNYVVSNMRQRKNAAFAQLTRKSIPKSKGSEVLPGLLNICLRLLGNENILKKC